MTEQEFETEMMRLKDTYGKTVYGHERVKLIWNAVRAFHPAWFKRKVDDFIGRSRTAPLVIDFQKLAANELDRKRYQFEKEKNDHQLSSTPSCSECEDTGVVMAKDQNNAIFAFGCQCSNHRGDSFPVFSQAHVNQGFVKLDPNEVMR